MSKENKHPYLASPGILTQVISQFRNKFPNSVDASILQKLSLAPKNESVVITTLKFLGFIDEKGKKSQPANDVFLKHDDNEFQTALSKVVKNAYAELFETHGDNAWNLDRRKLISFFRTSDETSELTATRQATTFETLASLSGKSTQEDRVVKPKTNSKAKKVSSKNTPAEKPSSSIQESKDKKGIGLTVRIEINLPAQGDQETYDRIFKSIQENLLK